MRGVIITFDAHAGFGTVGVVGGPEVFFHCTAIADGTRQIDVGSAVTFEVVPGHHGRWEAADVARRPPQP